MQKTWEDIQYYYRSMLQQRQSPKLERLLHLASYLRREPDMMMVYRDIATDTLDLLLWLPTARYYVHIQPCDDERFAVFIENQNGTEENNSRQEIELDQLMTVLREKLRHTTT